MKQKATQWLYGIDSVCIWHHYDTEILSNFAQTGFKVYIEIIISYITCCSIASLLLSTPFTVIFKCLSAKWEQAQLLAQDVENAAAASANETRSITKGDIVTTDNEMRKLLAHMFVDNASLRKQINSVTRCALNANIKSEEEEEDDEEEEQEEEEVEDEVHLRKTVLSKFLE